MLNAIQEVKSDWRKAIDKVGERASLTKDPNTRW
jgi:hypothetical protein